MMGSSKSFPSASLHTHQRFPDKKCQDQQPRVRLDTFSYNSAFQNMILQYLLLLVVCHVPPQVNSFAASSSSSSTRQQQQQQREPLPPSKLWLTPSLRNYLVSTSSSPRRSSPHDETSIRKSSSVTKNSERISFGVVPHAAARSSRHSEGSSSSTTTTTTQLGAASRTHAGESHFSTQGVGLTANARMTSTSLSSPLYLGLFASYEDYDDDQDMYDPSSSTTVTIEEQIHEMATFLALKLGKSLLKSVRHKKTQLSNRGNVIVPPSSRTGVTRMEQQQPSVSSSSMAAPESSLTEEADSTIPASTSSDAVVVPESSIRSNILEEGSPQSAHNILTTQSTPIPPVTPLAATTTEAEHPISMHHREGDRVVALGDDFSTTPPPAPVRSPSFTSTPVAATTAEEVEHPIAMHHREGDRVVALGDDFSTTPPTTPSSGEEGAVAEPDTVVDASTDERSGMAETSMSVGEKKVVLGEANQAEIASAVSSASVPSTLESPPIPDVIALDFGKPLEVVETNTPALRHPLVLPVEEDEETTLPATASAVMDAEIINESTSVATTETAIEPEMASGSSKSLVLEDVATEAPSDVLTVDTEAATAIPPSMQSEELVDASAATGVEKEPPPMEERPSSSSSELPGNGFVMLSSPEASPCDEEEAPQSTIETSMTPWMKQSQSSSSSSSNSEEAMMSGNGFTKRRTNNVTTESKTSTALSSSFTMMEADVISPSSSSSFDERDEQPQDIQQDSFHSETIDFVKQEYSIMSPDELASSLEEELNMLEADIESLAPDDEETFTSVLDASSMDAVGIEPPVELSDPLLSSSATFEEATMEPVDTTTPLSSSSTTPTNWAPFQQKWKIQGPSIETDNIEEPSAPVSELRETRFETSSEYSVTSDEGSLEPVDTTPLPSSSSTTRTNWAPFQQTWKTQGPSSPVAETNLEEPPTPVSELPDALLERAAMEATWSPFQQSWKTQVPTSPNAEKLDEPSTSLPDLPRAEIFDIESSAQTEPMDTSPLSSSPPPTNWAPFRQSWKTQVPSPDRDDLDEQAVQWPVDPDAAFVPVDPAWARDYEDDDATRRMDSPLPPPVENDYSFVSVSIESPDRGQLAETVVPVDEWNSGILFQGPPSKGAIDGDPAVSTKNKWNPYPSQVASPKANFDHDLPPPLEDTTTEPSIPSASVDSTKGKWNPYQSHRAADTSQADDRYIVPPQAEDDAVSVSASFDSSTKNKWNPYRSSAPSEKSIQDRLEPEHGDYQTPETTMGGDDRHMSFGVGREGPSAAEVSRTSSTKDKWNPFHAKKKDPVDSTVAPSENEGDVPTLPEDMAGPFAADSSSASKAKSDKDRWNPYAKSESSKTIGAPTLFDPWKARLSTVVDSNQATDPQERTQVPPRKINYSGFGSKPRVADSKNAGYLGGIDSNKDGAPMSFQGSESRSTEHESQSFPIKLADGQEVTYQRVPDEAHGGYRWEVSRNNDPSAASVATDLSGVMSVSHSESEPFTLGYRWTGNNWASSTLKPIVAKRPSRKNWDANELNPFYRTESGGYIWYTIPKYPEIPDWTKFAKYSGIHWSHPEHSDDEI